MPGPASIRPLLKPNQVAEILVCDRATVYRMMAAGELAFVPTRAGRRVRQEDLEAHIAAVRVPTNQERRPRRQPVKLAPDSANEDLTALADRLGLR